MELQTLYKQLLESVFFWFGSLETNCVGPWTWAEIFGLYKSLVCT